MNFQKFAGLSWILFLSTIFISSCGYLKPIEPSAETCADPETFENLKNVIFSNIETNIFTSKQSVADLRSNVSVEVKNSTASAIDKDLHKVECDGIITLHETSLLGNDMFRGGVLTARLKYSIQQSADKSGLVYEIFDASDLLQKLGTAAFLTKKSRPSDPSPEKVPDDIKSSNKPTESNNNIGGNVQAFVGKNIWDKINGENFFQTNVIKNSIESLPRGTIAYSRINDLVKNSNYTTGGDIEDDGFGELSTYMCKMHSCDINHTIIINYLVKQKIALVCISDEAGTEVFSPLSFPIRKNESDGCTKESLQWGD